MPRSTPYVIANGISAALTALVGARTAQGAWGWRAGAAGNTECTALVVLALQAWRQSGREIGEAANRGAEWLRARQRPDGSWPFGEQVPESCWATSLASIALAQAGPRLREQALAGGKWLLGSRSRGFTLKQRIQLALSREPQVADQDQQIPGWSWTAGTSAWVEPSSWALLALKQLRPALPRGRTAERIEDGHALLADRMCRGGGWNYGTKALLGVDLPPYPDTTALALLALQDHSAPDLTGPSLERLMQLIERNRSSLVLALSVLALGPYGRDVVGLRSELRLRLPALGADVDVRTLALVLLALDEQQQPLRVARHG